MALEVLTTADFDDKVVNAEGTVIVDIWATWCGPCKQLAPILNMLSEENADKASWFKVDADANPDTVSKYGVSSIPTLLVFKGGEVLHSITGAKPKSVLQEELNKFF
jgi:thioredoxin 1